MIGNCRKFGTTVRVSGAVLGHTEPTRRTQERGEETFS